MRKTTVILSLLTALAVGPVLLGRENTVRPQPNILWLVIDDMGADFSCYGETLIETPHIDRLAREGTRFTNAYLTAPVCSPARSSLITGMYQTTIGANNHLSGRGKRRIHLPGKVVPVPILFQKAGYTTTNGNYPKKSKGLGKTDYNFEWDRTMYDGGALAERNEGRPFFAQLQLWGGKNRHNNQWVRDDLVEHIDLAATSLALAGVTVPEWMQGNDILAQDYKPKKAVYAARDRCGETVDMIRSVRTKQYKYIRNFFPDRPLLQPTNYKDTKQILIRLRELHEAGKLNTLQEQLLFAPKRAPEELYDIKADPYETVNLAGNPHYRSVLKSMRQYLVTWMQDTHDPGPESAEVYAIEMEYQVGRNRNNPQSHAAIKRNVALYQRWATERPYRIDRE
jgi:arylsulfatase A-like enzyme